MTQAPFSAVAENVRAIKVAIDQHAANVPGGKIIGVTSSVPHEGKSSISMALATLIAQSGARTMLVDCDIRNSALSRLAGARTRKSACWSCSTAARTPAQCSGSILEAASSSSRSAMRDDQRFQRSAELKGDQDIVRAAAASGRLCDRGFAADCADRRRQGGIQSGRLLRLCRRMGKHQGARSSSRRHTFGEGRARAPRSAWC